MKKIILLRHGEAENASPEFPDVDRTLTKKGKSDISEIIKRLKKRKVKFDLLVTSNAKRAGQTAKILAKSFKYPDKKIVTNEKLYDDLSENSFLKIIQTLDDKAKSVLFIGHDPAFTRFVKFMVKNFSGNIPKSGVAVIQVNNNVWRSVSKNTGKLLLFDYPEKEAPSTNKIRKEIEPILSEKIRKALEDIDPEIAGTLTKSVNKSSTKLAKKFARKFADITDDESVLSKAHLKKSSAKKADTKVKKKSPEPMPVKGKKIGKKGTAKTGDPAAAPAVKNRKRKTEK